ncbi:MAG: hypothetical protein ACR2JC_04690 [Chloroflexota bacterium]
MTVEQVLPGTDTALASDVDTTVELLQRSTVQVRTDGMGAGSGVIWRSDGVIVTNAHVAPARTPPSSSGTHGSCRER